MLMKMSFSKPMGRNCVFLLNTLYQMPKICMICVRLDEILTNYFWGEGWDVWYRFLTKHPVAVTTSNRWK